MALRTRHSHASSLVVLSFLLIAGIGVFIAQTIATRQSLDAGSRAGELTPKATPSPTPNLNPTPLPTGKPAILGITSERNEVSNAGTSSSRDQSAESRTPRSVLQNSILFTVSGITVLLVAGFLLSSRTLILENAFPTDTTKTSLS
jgi:hypothetical protein